MRVAAVFQRPRSIARVGSLGNQRRGAMPGRPAALSVDAPRMRARSPARLGARRTYPHGIPRRPRLRAGRCRAARPGCRSARGSGRRWRRARWRPGRGRRAGAANRSSWSAACRWFTPTPNKRTRARVARRATRQQLGGDLGDGARVRGRRFEALLARESGEVGAPDLHLHAAGGEILRAHARAGAVGEPQYLGAACVRGREVCREGLLGADGFLVPLGHHRALVDARRRVRACAANRGRRCGHSTASGAVRSSSERVRCRPPRRFSPVLRPRPGRRRTDNGSSTARTSPAVTTVRPSGFSRSEAIFATSLLGATPTEALRLRDRADAVA